MRRRDSPDGLPFRVYEHSGPLIYSIGHKGSAGTWTWRLRCDANDAAEVAKTRRAGVKKANEAGDDTPSDARTFANLCALWIKRQEALPPSSPERRADSTLKENKREIAMLINVFGPMTVSDMEKPDAYDYLAACPIAVDKDGKPRPRESKGNKEISLARRILEYGVRLRWITSNPFFDVEKLVTIQHDRLVTDEELALALEVGRTMTAPHHIVACALKTACLCVRRSVEVRALTRPMIGKDGITWTGAKRQRGEAAKVVVIEWSSELRAIVDETLAIERYSIAGSWYVFGNLKGQKYTKGGWKKTLSNLMTRCVEVAAERQIAFQPFSLQDCRPMGVTAKMAQGHSDTLDATAHSSERMLRTVYDRRRVRFAKPVR